MTMRSTFILYATPFLNMIEDHQEIQKINEEKLADIRQKYFAAAELPRKKKKKLRKKLSAEYDLFYWIGEHEKQIFNF